MDRVAHQHHPPPVPVRDRRHDVQGAGGLQHLRRGGPHQLLAGCVARVGLAEDLEPALRGHGPGLGDGEVFLPYQVRAPGDPAVRRAPVEVVGPLAEGEGHGSRFDVHLGHGGRIEVVGPESEHAGPVGSRRLRVDQGAYGRADAVGSDQDVRGRAGAVGEARGDAAVVLVRAYQALAVGELDAGRHRRVVQHAVQFAARHHLERLLAAEGGRGSGLPAVDAHDGVGDRVRDRANRVGRPDDLQCGEPVGGEAEAAADAVGLRRVRLVDARLYAGPAQGHGRDRPGDAAADDQCGTGLRHGETPRMCTAAARGGGCSGFGRVPEAVHQGARRLSLDCHLEGRSALCV